MSRTSCGCTPRPGYALDVTADHLVWRSTGDGTGRFVEAGTLRPGDQLEWHRREALRRGRDRRSTDRGGGAGRVAAVRRLRRSVRDGTNRSLTIEAMTVTDDELAWVHGALDTVFPGAHRHERDRRRPRTRRSTAGGPGCTASICARSWRSGACWRAAPTWSVPTQLFTAPLPVVAAYLRSIFQAEGFVSAAERSTLVGPRHDLRGPDPRHAGAAAAVRHLRPGGLQGRSRGRTGTACWALRIQNAGDRGIFADEIGFIDPRKADKLEASFDLPGAPLGRPSGWRSPASRRSARWRSTTSRPSPASTSRATCGCTTASSSPSTTRWTRS